MGGSSLVDTHRKVINFPNVLRTCTLTYMENALVSIHNAVDTVLVHVIVSPFLVYADYNCVGASTLKQGRLVLKHHVSVDVG